MHLECLDCARRVPASVAKVSCADCNGLFRLTYDDPPDGINPRTPLSYVSKTVSLGEGETPLLGLGRTAARLGLESLSAKLEFMAPTGSFKDRGSAVLIGAAAAEGVGEFAEDSSGNAGASLSAYAAAAGIKAHIFVPANAAQGKLNQIRVFGAELHTVEGPRQAATDAAERFVAEHGMPYLSHNLSPYFSEGMKKFAHEIAAPGGALPVHIVLPVGNGSLLIGAKAGFEELLGAGKISSMPRFHAVQAENVRPLVAAVNGESWNADEVRPTVASGIAVSSPPRLAQCVEAVRTSGGRAIAVTDDTILDWQRRLAVDEGIFCEATSAAAFAGLERLVGSGAIGPAESVLVPITGSGLKEPLQS